MKATGIKAPLHHFQSGLTLDEWLDQKMQEMRESRTVICPNCKEMHEPQELDEELVTYWGEEGWLKVQCDECDVEFSVRENVERSYESKAVGE